MRQIDADAAIDALRGYLVEKRCPDDGTLTCRLIENEVINKLPSIQPERKKGKWIYDNGLKQFFCDQCGEPSLTYDDIYIYSMDFTNFCPNCGADMRGEQE